MYRVAERPCEHDDISDRTSVHLSGVTIIKPVGSQKHGSWQTAEWLPHMTSQGQREARTEGAQTPHLPVRATALRDTSLFDTS